MLTTVPRGTKDILPKDILGWQYVENKIREICALYGYEEIRTPIFEHTELFKRGIGEGTDVVDKEMYTFLDKGGKSLTLRPENTAAVVRAYLQNKLYAENNLVKLFYIGSMFRHDRPQAGRMREFHQFGIEAIGEENPALDAEIIILAVRFLESLGLKDLTLSINSVGCPHCRPNYQEKLQDFFRDKLDELCDDCKKRFETKPLRLLDCKVDGNKDFMQNVPKAEDSLCDECRSHFDEVKTYLNGAGIKYEVDSRLVRGLDYYTKTAFEIKYAPLGAQSAIAGGGRYDGLVEEIGGNSTPAVGFAAGLERVLLALESQKLLPKPDTKTEVFVIALGDEAKLSAFKLLGDLRNAGIKANMDYAWRSMKAQLKQANKFSAPYVVIMGEDEVKNNIVQLKNMANSEQDSVSLDNIVERLKRVL
ncbi:MAG: histidine--tRNA ligase [Selenomonadaceae bacterium]|nr:histidine--tRNA ligase [Selenomonadaceae bacterium]MBP3722888.1 histidine--tRNA ligase [Selenomonadaceae bacterium]